jgi:hypothetical protein
MQVRTFRLPNFGNVSTGNVIVLPTPADFIAASSAMKFDHLKIIRWNFSKAKKTPFKKCLYFCFCENILGFL